MCRVPTILSVLCALAAAAGMVVLAVSLPGKDPRGLLCGIGLPLLGMIAWTYSDIPPVVWAGQAVLGAAAVAIARPWRSWSHLPHRGGFWLAVPVWFGGAVSPLLLGDTTIAGQRLVYGGFALAVAAAVLTGPAPRRRPPGDPGTGAAAGFLICLAILLVSGAPDVLAGEHWTVGGEWGHAMSDRFWGGPGLGYHPNFIGLTAVMVAMRIGPDDRFTPWQRWGSVAVPAGILPLVGSRTALMVAFVAAGCFAVVHLGRNRASGRRLRRWWPDRARRHTLAVAVAPTLAVTLVFGMSGGVDLLVRNRYGTAETDSGVLNRLLSGRPDIWAAMLTDYAHDSPVEWLFGDAGNARGVHRTITDPDDPRYTDQAQHTADNAVVGMLYRGGVAGTGFLAVGLWLLIRRVWRRAGGPAPPTWTIVVVAALLVGGFTEDEIAGTTPAWLLLCCAEIATIGNRVTPPHTASIPPKTTRSSPNGRPLTVTD